MKINNFFRAYIFCDSVEINDKDKKRKFSADKNELSAICYVYVRARSGVCVRVCARTGGVCVCAFACVHVCMCVSCVAWWEGSIYFML